MAKKKYVIEVDGKRVQSGLYAAPSKRWLGKRLTNTEGDGLWCYVSKAGEPLMQLMLQQLGPKLWVANLTIEHLYVSSKDGHKTEWEARTCVERQLKWYQKRIEKALSGGVNWMALPPLKETI